MKHKQITRKRERILRRLPDLQCVLRGSLLQRTIRHRVGCPKCDRGEGHPVWVLTVGYPGGRTRQISLRREVVPQVRRWLHNYQKLRAIVEEVCEMNQQLLRPESADRRRRQGRG